LAPIYTKLFSGGALPQIGELTTLPKSPGKGEGNEGKRGEGKR